MAELTVQSIGKAGLELPGALAAASNGGDTVKAAGSNLMIAVENSGGVGRTVTVVTPVATTACNNFGDLPVSNLTISVGAGELQVFTIPAGYRDGSGNFPITYDDEADLTIGAFSLA